MASEWEQLNEQLISLKWLYNARVLLRPLDPWERPDASTRWWVGVFENFPNGYYGALSRYKADFDRGEKIETGSWLVVSGPDPRLARGIWDVGSTPEDALRRVLEKLEREKSSAT